MAVHTPDQIQPTELRPGLSVPGWRWRRASRAGRPPAMLVIPAVMVGLVMLLPLVYIVMRAAESDTSIWNLILREQTGVVLRNSVMLATAVAGAGTLIAVPLAWLTTRTDLPCRRFWTILAGLPLVIPSYVGALAIVAALGPRGMLQGWLEGPFGVERLPDIYGFTGAWITLTLFTYPYIFMSVRAALKGLDPSLEDASRCLGYGSWRTFYGCVLPQLRPAIASGGLLAALYTISDFGVVTLLRYDVFTRAIYVQYRSSFDRSAAAVLAALLVLVAIGLVVAEGRVRGNHTYHAIGSSAKRVPRTIALGRWTWPSVTFCGLIALSALGLPIFVLVYWIARGVTGGEGVGRLPELVGNSLTAGGLAAVATTLAALPVAALAVRHRGWVGQLGARVAYLGYALPGIVIALAFVYFGANHVPTIYQSMLLLVIAYAVRFLPQAVGAQRLSMLQLNPRLEEASRTLGRSAFQTLARVTLPLTRPGVLTGAALVMLTVMKDLPITLILSPIGFDTLATEIWQYTTTGSYGRAAAPALALVLLSAIPSLLLTTRAGDQPVSS
ncbi:MAG: ABC transporter permease [Thermomicrobiales bacterium]